MTQEQRQHCQDIATSFGLLMTKKYFKGAQEHGGNLWDMSAEKLLDNALDEAIDQVVYLITLKRDKFPELLEKAWKYDDLQ